MSVDTWCFKTLAERARIVVQAFTPITREMETDRQISKLKANLVHRTSSGMDRLHNTCYRETLPQNIGENLKRGKKKWNPDSWKISTHFHKKHEHSSTLLASSSHSSL